MNDAWPFSWLVRGENESVRGTQDEEPLLFIPVGGNTKLNFLLEGQFGLPSKKKKKRSNKRMFHITHRKGSKV